MAEDNTFIYSIDGLFIPEKCDDQALLKEIETYVIQIPGVCEKLTAAMEGREKEAFLPSVDLAIEMLGKIYAISLKAEAEALKRDWYHSDKKLCRRVLPYFVTKAQSLSIDIQMAQIEQESHINKNIREKVLSGIERKQRKILTVDDRPEILKAVTGSLSAEYTVLGATGGKMAQKVMEHTKFDLFVLDIDMPEMNGFELASWIRQQEDYQTTPIIFLTGNSYKEYVVQALECGGNDFVIKPVDGETLLNRVKMYL